MGSFASTLTSIDPDFYDNDNATNVNNRRTFLRVNVTAAEKQQEGMFASYIQYTIRTSLIVDDPSNFDLPTTTNFQQVFRRYSDFELLAQQLKTWEKCLSDGDDLSSLRRPLLPSLPKKRKFRVKRNTSEEHAEDRRIR